MNGTDLNEKTTPSFSNYLIIFLVFLIPAMLDLVTFYIMIDKHGIATEVNPIASYLYHVGGPEVLGLTKLLTVVLATLAYGYVHQSYRYIIIATAVLVPMLGAVSNLVVILGA